MREDNKVSRPSTIRDSTKYPAQLRPVRLEPSAYPSSTAASGVKCKASNSDTPRSAHTANAETGGTAAGYTATANGRRFAEARDLIRKLNETYWQEDKLIGLYNKYGAAGGPDAEEAKTRQETASKLIDDFGVYDEKYVQV